MTIERKSRKTRIGVVSSNKMTKTITVSVERKVKHPIYGKFLKKSSSFHAHDEKNEFSVGDLVWIEEARPISKLKRWQVVRGEKRSRTEAPIEVAVWTNEEGCRFAPAMVASGVFGGAFTLEHALSIKDRDGVSFAEALKKIGYDGPEKVGGRKVGAFFEAHIEQGPILEREKKKIGVVTGAQGQRWYEISWTGMESHAGTTPMEGRRDALVGAAELIVKCREIGNRPNGRSTSGVIESQPQSRNTIPGRVFMTIDFRHPDDGELTKMDVEMRAAAADIARRHRLDVKIEQIWYFPPSPFARELVESVRRGAEQAGYPHMDIVSGAGHDACYVSRVAPTAMIFVPCKDGISHNEVEDATRDDVGAGCQILLQAMVERANA